MISVKSEEEEKLIIIRRLKSKQLAIIKEYLTIKK
jgi:hypothetical protein